MYVPKVVGATSIAQTTKGAQPATVWDRESFLDAARSRCSGPEVMLIQRLLEDVDGHGVRFRWGTGATPGVSGWYDCAGQICAVWTLNANNELPHTRAYLYFYLADVANRVGTDRFERAAQRLESIPSLRSKIADVRAGNWRKYPSLYLADIAADEGAVAAIFDAIRILTATP